jgi:hypothetical protein
MSNYPAIPVKSGKLIVRGVFRVNNSTLNAINRRRPAMPEKLVQAAIITFLLHLIAGLSSNTKIQTKLIAPASEIPEPVVSLLLHSFQ